MSSEELLFGVRAEIAREQIELMINQAFVESHLHSSKKVKKYMLTSKFTLAEVMGGGNLCKPEIVWEGNTLVTVNPESIQSTDKE